MICVCISTYMDVKCQDIYFKTIYGSHGFQGFIPVWKKICFAGFCLQVLRAKDAESEEQRRVW